MIILNTHKNFWLEYPDYLSLEIFRDLHSKDKSKNKEESSKLVWSLFLFIHPDSLYFNMNEKDKISLINSNYHKIDFKKYKEHLQFLEPILLSPAKRQLYQWKIMIDERKEFLDNTKYANETYDMLEKMHSNTPKLLQQYKQIELLIESEGEQSKNQGGGELSANEKGLI